MKWDKDDTTAVFVVLGYASICTGGYVISGIGGLLQSLGLALILTAMNRSYCHRLMQLL